MKIKKITYNNKKKNFEIMTSKQTYLFPYSRLRLKPTTKNKIKEVYIDEEIGREGFTYVLQSEKQDSIHLDQVLEYNADPEYLLEILLYKLTIKAQKLLNQSKISKREIIRRMNTSPTQFYRLIDPSFYNKSIDQMVKLLCALDCRVDIVFNNAA